MNKKKLKNVLLMAILGLGLMTFCVNVNAAGIDNKTAYSVGTNYKKNFLSITQIDTTEDAEHANSVYKKMGWKTTLNTIPTKSNMQGKYSNGYYYLESSILFFSGHGNYLSMGWNYKESGGNYDVNIVASSGNLNYSDGSLGIGLGRFDSSQNDLVIFGGCETAKGSSNIAKYVVDRGAETSIGWKESTSDGSHRNWLERFNDELSDNNTSVNAAAVSASDHIYLNNSVKNYVIYGNKNQIPAHGFIIAMSNNKINSQNKKYILNKNIILDKSISVSDNIKNSINAEISNISPSFNEEDYRLEINGVDTKTYDYVLYVNGVRTNLGYTVFVDDNVILSITDNTNNVNLNNLKNNIQSKSSAISSKKIKSITESAIKETSVEYSNYQVSLEDQITYFDTNTNKLYQVTLIKVENNRGQKSVVENYKEL